MYRKARIESKTCFLLLVERDALCVRAGVRCSDFCFAPAINPNLGFQTVTQSTVRSRSQQQNRNQNT